MDSQPPRMQLQIDKLLERHKETLKVARDQMPDILLADLLNLVVCYTGSWAFTIYSWTVGQRTWDLPLRVRRGSESPYYLKCQLCDASLGRCFAKQLLFCENGHLTRAIYNDLMVENTPAIDDVKSYLDFYRPSVNKKPT